MNTQLLIQQLKQLPRVGQGGDDLNLKQVAKKLQKLVNQHKASTLRL
jgi:hypothetical protein